MATAIGTATDLRPALAAVVGDEHVRDDAGALLTFSIDVTPLERGRPDVVVFPASTEEVAAVIRLANERRVPVIPRGSGTNLSAGTVPQRGGNVAECSGGLRALKYGVTRDYVLGVEAVLGSGEVIRSGGRLVKDVAGYDLRRLLCGSEGTLAVMTELTMRLMPAPEATGTGMAYFDDLAAAARAVSRVLAEGVLPVTLEFLDRVCIDAVEGYANIGLDRSAGALLIFGQDGDRASIDRDMRRMADACKCEGATSVRIAASEEEAADVLQARRAVLPALSRLEPLTILEDATVPRSRIAEMVARIQEIAEREGLTIGTFGHAGDGNLHPTVVLDAGDNAAVERAHAAFDDIFAIAIEMGGSITGEHGVGLVKLRHLERQLGAEQLALLRRIKAAFDPNGILNPGKLGS